MAAHLGTSLGALVLPAIALAITAILITAHWRAARATGDFGATTLVAAVVTFALGALAGLGEIEIAAPVAVILTLLLGTKPELHALVKRIERDELSAALHLLLVSVVLLPVLPDRGYGPWNALNPYRLWWMVVLIAGLSFVGYIAIKLIGTKRGVMATALLGGLVSSTAVTLDLARLSRTLPSARQACRAGILLATAVMLPRILLVAGIIDPSLLRWIVWPLGSAAVVLLGAGLWTWRQVPGGGPDTTSTPRNPFEFSIALQFGALLAVIMLLSQALTAWLGDRGLLVLAAVSGLADVDAITLSAASMAATEQIARATAGLAVLCVAGVNTLVKPVLVLFAADRRLALSVLGPMLLAVAFGAGAAVLLTL